MKQLWIIVIIGILAGCGSSGNNKELSKADLMKAFVEKVGYVELPYTHDLNLDEENYQYLIDSKSTDTLFFNSYDKQIIGVLPNTSGFYAILYYSVGDDLYPSLKTFSKNGELIDSKEICYGLCAGCICECDSCSDITSISRDLRIAMSFYVKATECDSTGEQISGTTICKAYSTDGYIKPDGMIVLNERKEIDCE